MLLNSLRFSLSISWFRSIAIEINRLDTIVNVKHLPFYRNTGPKRFVEFEFESLRPWKVETTGLASLSRL